MHDEVGCVLSSKDLRDFTNNKIKACMLGPYVPLLALVICCPCCMFARLPLAGDGRRTL
jgi:hypothetical protein